MRALVKLFALVSRLAAIPVILTILFFNVFWVPKDSLGILTHKQNGETLLLSSGYHWQWSGFVPGLWNWETVAILPMTTNVVFSQGLRYTAYLAKPHNFQFRVKVRLQYLPKNENIASFLYKFANDTKKTDLYINEKTQDLLRRKFIQLYQNEESVATLEKNFRVYINDKQGFEQDWQNSDMGDYFSIKNIAMTEINVPPAQLYYSQSREAEKYMLKEVRTSLQRLQTEQNRRQEQAAQDSILKNELARLQAIGEVIRKNPYILEYLKIEKLNSHASVIMLDGNLEQNLTLPLHEINANDKEKK